LRLTAAAAALPAISRVAGAQSYPSRPVRIIVTFPPGGSNDFHARLIGQWLFEKLGQPFVVEHRPGGGGNIGTEAAARSAADGYTLLMLSASLAINPAFYAKLSYDIVRDTAPVAALYRASYVMVVNRSFPARTAAEVIAYAKANPGRINFGSQGVGATGHLAGELFKMLAGVEMQHVPYRGVAPAMTDLISGQIQLMFTTMTDALPIIREGHVRALAVTSLDRSPALPDIPPLAGVVPGYELNSWSGMAAPRDTPAEIVNRLNREINAGLASPIIKDKYADLGLNTFAASPDEFGKLIADDVEKWKKVIKAAGIQPI
jgi:tripartite-type tricarboxylate transporter receptor subunit TctC